jgi:hypothetical protein
VISWKTIFSLLLALLLAGCIKAYTLRLQNPCDAYLAGQAGAPATVVTNTQGRAMEIPCDSWFLRQPRAVQAWCMFDGALGVIFLISAWADWRRRGSLLL